MHRPCRNVLRVKRTEVEISDHLTEDLDVTVGECLEIFKELPANATSRPSDSELPLVALKRFFAPAQPLVIEDLKVFVEFVGCAVRDVLEQGNGYPNFAVPEVADLAAMKD